MLQVTSPRRPLSAADGSASALLAAITPERAALAAFLVVAGIVLARIIALTGGASLYSLDDAYIHLALAERIRLGHYGLNMGETTSPSSSVIWPFLLVPTAGTSLALYTPLALNVLFGGATAWLLGRSAAMPALPASWPDIGALGFRIALGCLLVLAFNLVNLVFTGLEHSLQVLIAVVLAYALITHAVGKSLPAWALALGALGPAVRYEMLALTAAVALMLALERRWRAAAMLIGASLVLPAGLACYLVYQGGYPLPNSVMAKLMPQGAPIEGDILTVVWKIIAQKTGQLFDIDWPARLALLGAIVIAAVLARQSKGPQRHLLLCAIAAGALHFAAGQFGWWYRYELYALVFCGVIALGALVPKVPYAALLCAIGLAHHYLPSVSHTPMAALNLHEQQHQMHRLVRDHYRKPFAVNDVGWVSLGLAPNTPVLDLWGLASNEALRQTNKSAAWLDDVTRRHGTGMAMIYTSIFKEIPASWTKAGELRLASRRITAAHEVVTIYATAVGDRAEIATALGALRTGLPAGVRLTIQAP